MQDVVGNAGICDMKVSDDVRAMENHVGKLAISKVLQSLDNRPEPEFHHVFLMTELKDKEDYKRLRLNEDWSIPSDRNKGRVLERRLSLHRVLYSRGLSKWHSNNNNRLFKAAFQMVLP